MSKPRAYCPRPSGSSKQKVTQMLPRYQLHFSSLISHLISHLLSHLISHLLSHLLSHPIYLQFHSLVLHNLHNLFKRITRCKNTNTATIAHHCPSDPSSRHPNSITYSVIHPIHFHIMFRSPSFSKSPPFLSPIQIIVISNYPSEPPYPCLTHDTYTFPQLSSFTHFSSIAIHYIIFPNNQPYVIRHTIIFSLNPSTIAVSPFCNHLRDTLTTFKYSTPLSVVSTQISNDLNYTPKHATHRVPLETFCFL